ncbi:uncharacterized protein LOC142219569 [Haematobia irritans]|uniref:uncharacterized protein LOC142219569 n=1 Tax=Haematobia irritans TaxID=7368 RepID=UPI003F4FFC3E
MSFQPRNSVIVMDVDEADCREESEYFPPGVYSTTPQLPTLHYDVTQANTLYQMEPWMAFRSHVSLRSMDPYGQFPFGDFAYGILPVQSTFIPLYEYQPILTYPGNMIVRLPQIDADDYYNPPERLRGGIVKMEEHEQMVSNDKNNVTAEKANKSLVYRAKEGYIVEEPSDEK